MSPYRGLQYLRHLVQLVLHSSSKVTVLGSIPVASWESSRLILHYKVRYSTGPFFFDAFFFAPGWAWRTRLGGGGGDGGGGGARRRWVEIMIDPRAVTETEGQGPGAEVPWRRQK